MQRKDQTLLEEAYQTILKEDNSKWAEHAPDSPGFWWFYGDMTYGAVRGIPPNNKLSVVQMHNTGSGLQATSNGSFLYLNPYKEPEEGKKQKEGYLGVWQKMEMPQLPSLGIS